MLAALARDGLPITLSTLPGGNPTLQGGQDAAAPVASCEEALARFESEALSADRHGGSRAYTTLSTKRPRSKA
jgi:hypothetical protein